MASLCMVVLKDLVSKNKAAFLSMPFTQKISFDHKTKFVWRGLFWANSDLFCFFVSFKMLIGTNKLLILLLKLKLNLLAHNSPVFLTFYLVQFSLLCIAVICYQFILLSFLMQKDLAHLPFQCYEGLLMWMALLLVVLVFCCVCPI